MLVLTRKLQQQIRISDNITITVLRVKGNTVRLGIDAPRQVRVVRGQNAPASMVFAPLSSPVVMPASPHAGHYQPRWST